METSCFFEFISCLHVTIRRQHVDKKTFDLEIIQAELATGFVIPYGSCNDCLSPVSFKFKRGLSACGGCDRLRRLNLENF